MILLKSQQGGDQIIDDDLHAYRIRETNKHSVRWTCIFSSCRSSAKTVLDYIRRLFTFNLYKPHNHPPDVEKAVRKPIIDKMKARMIESNDSPRNVAYSCLFGANVEILRAMGSFENLFRILRDYRLKHINPIPYANLTLKLNESLLKTHLNTKFYQYGPENYRELTINNDIVIFYSDIAMNKLKTQRILAVDGTFSVVPEPYYQLYTVSYIQNHHVFPCVFALLKKKSQTTYAQLFDILIRLEGPFAVEIFKTDFELSAIKGLQEKFPETSINGCMFHLGQAIDRKIKDLMLTNTYVTSLTFRKYTKALLALAYVNFEDLIPEFELLKASQAFPVSITPLYNYFYSNFLSPSSRFPPTIWHSRNLNDPTIPRTNNAIEGWHNTFANTFGLCRHSFYMLVKKLKDEEEVIRLRSIQQDDLNIVFERRERYIQREIALFEYLNERGENRTELSYIFDLVSILNSYFYIFTEICAGF